MASTGRPGHRRGEPVPTSFKVAGRLLPVPARKDRKHAEPVTVERAAADPRVVSEVARVRKAWFAATGVLPRPEWSQSGRTAVIRDPRYAL